MRHVPAERLYHRRHALVSFLFWIIMVAIFAGPALEFSHRIQSTLTGMTGTPSETVRQSVVKNFSTALAFPTAIVWDAQGVPQDQADAAWKNALEAIRADHQVDDVTDGQVMVDKWPRGSWHAAFVAVNATTYGEAEKVISR